MYNLFLSLCSSQASQGWPRLRIPDSLWALAYLSAKIIWNNLETGTYDIGFGNVCIWLKNSG